MEESDLASGRSEVVILGTLPPPITGMTLLTEQMVMALQQRGHISIFDWSTGISRRGLVFRLARVGRLLASVMWLMRRGPARGTRLYLVANSKAGLYFTAIIAWLGRRLRYTVYLHHHTYCYIDTYDWRLAWIDRTLGKKGVHVVHTPQMAKDLAAMYPTECTFAFVYPSVVAAPLGSPRESLCSPIRLGCLSNFSVAKGIDLVLETLYQLQHGGQPVRLTLAGAFLTNEGRRLVERAVKEYPDEVEYVGPLYGADKRQFLEAIDCFLFPSRSESWGIVLHEAMAAGVPVITFDRGCTRTVVGEKAGRIVDSGANFPQMAADQIKKWADHPNEYRIASQAAIEQADHLQREGQRTLNAFVDQMFSCARSEERLHRPA